MANIDIGAQQQISKEDFDMDITDGVSTDSKKNDRDKNITNPSVGENIVAEEAPEYDIDDIIAKYKNEKKVHHTDMSTNLSTKDHSHSNVPFHNHSSNGEIYTKINLADYIHRTQVPAPIDLKKYILKTEIPPQQKIPNLKKYILKSEIPKSPNMTKYMLKSQVPTCPKGPEMDQFIRKTEIPVCSTIPDMSKFLLKSSIPPQQKCPNCVNSCPSPCKMVKKVISCKKQPLICAPVNQPAARTIMRGVINTKKDTTPQKLSRPPKLPKPKIKKPSNTFKQNYIQKQKQKKQLSTNILAYQNIRKKNTLDTSINKTSNSQILNKVFSQKHTNLSKVSIVKPKFKPKKCVLTNKIVKKSGVYGPY